MKCRELQIANAILSKMSNVNGITVPDFKVYCRSIVIKNSMVLTQKQTYQPMEPKTQR
jgi:hypothetical protein